MVKRNSRRVVSGRAPMSVGGLLVCAAVLVGFGVLVVLRSMAATEPVGPAGNWSMVFDDEFNAGSLDSTHWARNWFGGGTMNNVKTLGTNVYVQNGYLNLNLSSSSEGALVDSDPSQVKPGFEFGSGYYAEARVYFPGSGSTVDNWPAFWTDGQNWPKDGETDIAEGLGTLTSNYHSSSGANNSGTIPGTWAGGWHTYGVDRESGKNYVWWDGKIVRSYATNDGGALQYLIFNIGSGQGPAVYGVNSHVKVDYVRVWKNMGPGTPTPTPTVTGSATPQPTTGPSQQPTPVPPVSGGGGGGGSSAGGSTGGGSSGAAGSTSGPSEPPQTVTIPGTNQTAEVVPIPEGGASGAFGGTRIWSGIVKLGVPTGAYNVQLTVDDGPVIKSQYLDTTYLQNGIQEVVVSYYDAQGQTQEFSLEMKVENKLNILQILRNRIFLSLHGQKTQTDIASVVLIVVLVGGGTLGFMRARKWLVAYEGFRW